MKEFRVTYNFLSFCIPHFDFQKIDFGCQVFNSLSQYSDNVFKILLDVSNQGVDPGVSRKGGGFSKNVETFVELFLIQ